MSDHEHVYEPTFSRSRIAGTLHRKCTELGCDAITLDNPPYEPPAAECDAECDECGRSMRSADAFAGGEFDPEMFNHATGTYGETSGGEAGKRYCPGCWWGEE